MIPTERFQAATDDTVTPFLFWSELAVCAGGRLWPARNALRRTCIWTRSASPPQPRTTTRRPSALASSPNRRDPRRQPGPASARGQNRGPMLSVGYWCEDDCRGRIELREHKGHLFASLQDQPPLGPEDVVLAENLYARRAVGTCSTGDRQ